MKLTVVILTHNNQELIQGCLNSVKSLGKILIIDDYSIDKTLEFAKEYQVQIIQKHLTNFSVQRNFGLSQVKTPWALFLDSDERLTSDLAKEINQVINNTQNSAYRMKRLNYFFNHPVKHGGYWPDWQTRLFKVKDFQKFSGSIHETPHFSGHLGDLKNHLTHFSHRNLVESLEKSLIWTKKEAQEFIKAGHPPITCWRIIKIMVWEFCYRYFKQKAFLDGFVGFTESLLQAINRYFVYQQIWEMQQQPSIKSQYEKLDSKIQ